MSTSILIRAPTSGRISCATASTWVPTLNTCGFKRLPAGERQQLSGQLGGALHGLGNRVDVAPAPLFRQFAAAQEIGRGADDGQEIVEIVRHAAGQLSDRFHLLRLAQRFLALAALGDVDGLRHRADDRAVLVAQRTHREVEIALADRQAQQHLGLDFFAPHHGDEGVADGVAHAFGVAENHGVSQNGLPITSLASVRIPASAVLLAYRTSPCRLSSALILMAGLEDRAHLGFAGFQLRRPLGDPQFEDFVQPAQIVLGLLGGGDVVGDADEADVVAGRIPARLGFRAQPSPFAVGALVAGFQHERLERGLAGDQFLHDPRLVVRMQPLAPVEHDGFLERQPEEIDIGLVGEGARAVELGDPDRHRRAVGDQAEALLAFAQGCPAPAFESVTSKSAPTRRSARPSRSRSILATTRIQRVCAVIRPHDAVFGRIVLALALQRRRTNA